MITLLLQPSNGVKPSAKTEHTSTLLDFKSLLFDAKKPQKNVLATALETLEQANDTLNTTSDSLLTLLNPELLQKKPTQDIHLLIAQAKERLQHAINEAKQRVKEGFGNEESLSKKVNTIETEKELGKADLPKHFSLRALLQQADALNINLRTITLDQHHASATHEKVIKTPLFNPALTTHELIKIAKQTNTVQPAASELATLLNPFKPQGANKNSPDVSHGKSIQPISLELHSFSNVLLNDKPALKQASMGPAASLVNLLNTTQQLDTRSTPVETNAIEKLTHHTPLHTTALSSEPIELKSAEAKQSVANFANQLAREVENYKPPFTRIKMALQPAKLGDVDVTMIQRGNNIHITLNANSTAITLFAQHANELKAQLATHGINDSSMQFNASFNQQQQQQQRQQQPQYASANHAQPLEEQPFFELTIAHNPTYA